MAAKVYAKYPLEPDAKDVHGRFTSLYSSSKSKQFLTYQCVAGGMLLKECGLLELTISICESEAYINATTASQRRALLLGELGALIGAIKDVPAAPAGLHNAIREPSAATQDAAGAPPDAPAAAEHIASTQEEQPVSQKRPQVRMQGVELPNIGASTNSKK
ncbi:hypothetical protein ABKY47_002065 [Aeromonas hydrophila]